jgi:hypothetical protein
MNEYYSVVVSRVYKISKAEVEIRQTNKESEQDTAKRIALQTMSTELMRGLLEPGDDDFTVKCY